MNFQKESWEKPAKVPAMVTSNCFYLWLSITDGRVRVGCEMLCWTSLRYLFLFHLYCTVAEMWSLSQVFLVEICKVKGKGFTILIKILITGVGKWDKHASSAWHVTGVCPWWLPSFAEVCLSPVGPVPLWIYNYIFIRSEIVCLVIKTLLWNVNPSGACPEQ